MLIKKENILITGSKGQLGRQIKLVSYKFKCYRYFFEDKTSLNINEFKLFESFVIENNITTIINCAAYTNVNMAEENRAEAAKINYESVCSIGKICKKYFIKLIHISTDYVFNELIKSPLMENHLTNPVNYYGLTKLMGEKSLIKINIPDSIILRTSWLYSDSDNNFVSKIISMMNENKKISVVKNEISSPTNAKDLAITILKIIPMIKNKNLEIFHFSNKGFCSRFDFALEIKKIIGSKCEIKPEITKSEIKRPFSSLNCEKIQKTYKIELRPWKKALRDNLKKLQIHNEI